MKHQILQKYHEMPQFVIIFLSIDLLNQNGIYREINFKNSFMEAD